MINWRLWIGALMTFLIFLIAIIGPAIAPYEEDYVEPSGYFYHSSENFGINAAPFPPSKDHLLGTDRWGYDILTLLLYGAKYTVFVGIIVALIRMVIGGILGLWMGVGSKQRIGGNSFGVLGGIPAFLIIYFAMAGITINSNLSMMELVIIQSILMSLVGIPGVYAAVFSKTKELKKNQFITSSQSLGAGTYRIAVKHMYPHLKGTLLVMFIKEIILTLSLIGQLGIFNIFLGGTIHRLNSNIYLSVSHEWAGLIGQWRSFIYDYQWILFYPLLAFVIVIFSFYILSRGIELKQRAHMQKYPHI